MAVVACPISLKDATLLISAKLRWVCVESSRIRENSDAFHGIAANSHESGYGIASNSHESGYGIGPNSHESGYKETSRSAPSEAELPGLRASSGVTEMLACRVFPPKLTAIPCQKS